MTIFLCFVSPPLFAQFSWAIPQEAAPQAQNRTGRIDTPLDTNDRIEDLSEGATFRFGVAPKLPLFTFKIIPDVRDDVHGFPQSTVRDVEVFKGELDQVSLRLNQRPRKTLGFETPADKLQASVASTV